MNFITPILLAGGSGTRLWPLSRRTYPKQFIKLTANETLFQQSSLRFVSSNFVKFKSQITITNSSFRFVVIEQLQNVGIDPGTILIEPVAKNTAAAVIAGTIVAYNGDKDAIIISAPTDHVIPDIKYFNEAIISGLDAVNSGKIVTFGVRPTYPDTGYGYLKLEQSDKEGPKSVLNFIEKPDKKLAMTMFKNTNYFWNSGIFMFRAKDMIDAYYTYAEDILSYVIKAVNLSVIDMGFTRLDQNYWKKIREISIDYAIMEKAKNLVGVPYYSHWSDLGNWDSVWRETEQDSNGVASSKNAHAIDCKNTLLRSENKSQQLVGLGLQDIIAIAMPDAVLVANKNNSHDVKNVVEHLRLQNVQQSEIYPKDYRPWGWFEILIEGNGFKVKRIFVKPGASLSLQSHKHRSEHWVVVNGKAKITIDKDVKIAKEGQSTYVPLGSLHRIENPGKTPTIIIEIQIGTYLGEDDIVRFDDVYSRK